MKKHILLIVCLISLIATNTYAQPANDECATAQNLGTLPTPAACPSGLGTAVTVAGTVATATPSNPYIYQNGCSGAGGPNMGVPASDVWYSFVASGYEAVISITSTFANPNVAMYAGSCASLGGGIGGCAVGTGGTVTLTVEQMVIGTTYYLQVSGNSGQSGTFNLSVKNNKGCSDCINSTTLTVSPLPVNGMYNPGQTVHFCYHINSYAEINTNWLHGVQVGLGSGWNAASLVASPITSYDCGIWTYYPAGITDPGGTAWPAGFYFNRTCAPLGGGTAGDGIPGNNYGDHITPNTTGDQNIHAIPAAIWNFCFDVTVANGCNPGSNLSVIINTSGDGESGPWTSAGCASDPATPFNAVGACCQPTMSSVPASCAGNDGTATATPVGAAGPYDYVWANAGGTVSTTTGVAGANTISGLSPGTYTVTITNALNCAITNTVAVTGAGASSTPTAGSNSPICEGSNLNLTAANVAGASYSWVGPNGFSSLIQNPTITGTTAAAAGIYTVTATVGGCLSTSTVSVVINPVPTVTVPPNIIVCNAGNVSATNFNSTPAGATFSWSNSNTAIGLVANGTGNIAAFTATNITSNPISSTITVTPTLAGCTGTPATYTITVNPTPTVVVPSNIAVCNGATIGTTNFTSATPGTTFTWTNSNTTIGLAANGSGNIAAFSGANATISPITASITVTPAANGCQGTPSTYTITVNPTPTVIVPANIIVCDGGNIATTNFTSPTTGTTYTWTNSNTSIGLAANGVGNISSFTATNPASSSISATITVTPTANGCPGTPNTYTITVNPTPTVVVPANTTVCNNTIIPATTFTSPVTGATYTWTNSNTAIGIPANGVGDISSFNATNTGIAAITATITVTPSAGCIGTPNSYTITVNPTPTVTVPLDIIVCDGGNISATNFTSPVTGTTFSWTNSNIAIGLPANGTGNIPAYTASNSSTSPINATISVTPAANTCTGPLSSYNITINPIATVVVPSNITVCNSSTVPATNFTSPVAGVTFSWTNSNTIIGLAASGTGNIAAFAAVNSGTSPITATITVTPVGSCPEVSNTYTITVNPSPTVVVPSNITVCSGVTIPVTNFTSPVAGATFGWTNSATSIGLGASGIGNVPAFTGTNLTAIPVTATVTVVPTANSCVGTPNNYTITVNPIPVVNAGPNDTICFGQNTNISASPSGAGYSYRWLPSAGLSDTTIFNPVANPSSTTTYTITTTLNGCSGSDSIIIYSDPRISIAKTAINVTCNGACNGQTIVIPNGGTGIFSYSWSSGCVTASCSSLCPGSYTVTVTDSWGCTSTADTVVTEPPLLTAAITAQTQTSCNGICDGTATAAGSGGSPATAGYSYSWNIVPTQNTSNAINLCAGPYTVTVTDSLGCQAATNVTIIEPSPVVVPPIAPVTICIGSSSIITAVPSGGNGGYQYSWLPAGTGGNTPTVTVSPIVTTIYTVNVTDLNGCTTPPVADTVHVNPPLNVIASGTTSICPGSSTPISAIASGGDGSYTYSWTPAGTGSGTPITVTPASTTLYTVTVNDGCGTPPASDNVTVSILPLPNPVFSANIVSGCAPLCVDFTDASTIASGSVNSWTWDFDGDGNSNLQNPSHCFNTPGQYSITLTDVSAAGCTYTYTDINMITVFALPTAEFSDFPNPASTINSSVSFTDQSSADVNYWLWNFGDAANSATSNIQNPVHIYPNTAQGTYTATLYVQNINGCIDSVKHIIEIAPEFTFFIPNAFTPNDDGVNDFFNGAGIGIVKYEMYIFDRWGNLIFDTDSLYKPWDGKANHGSEMAQQDVYVWKVDLTDVFGKKHHYIGSVTIVK